MVNILLSVNDTDFKADLENQISRSVSDVNFTDTSPDIIIVDENRYNLETLRSRYSLCPLIYLTQEDLLGGGKLNIIIKKPLRLMNLLDVIRSANNHLDNSEEGILSFNGYCLYPNKRVILNSHTGKTIKLTEKEIDIIKYLYKHSNEFVGKSDLQKNVWQYSNEVTTHTIETHIYRLRQKIETDDNHRFIETSGGKYRLKTDDNA